MEERYGRIVTEAMKKVIDFAQKELHIFEIVGRYAKENPASGNVMRKLGFQYEKDIPYPCNDGAVMREGIQCRLGLEESYENLLIGKTGYAYDGYWTIG